MSVDRVAYETQVYGSLRVFPEGLRVAIKPHVDLPSARSFRKRDGYCGAARESSFRSERENQLRGFQEQRMRFIVTSGADVVEVVDHPESARAALEQVLALLARKRNDVRIFDENGRRRTPADLCRLAAQEVAMLPDNQWLDS
jgi:hypothetical protein